MPLKASLEAADTSKMRTQFRFLESLRSTQLPNHPFLRLVSVRRKSLRSSNIADNVPMKCAHNFDVCFGELASSNQ